MSHFSVIVKLPASAIHNVEAAVANALAPYQENNMGDCPKEYLVFEEVEDEGFGIDPTTGKRGYWDNPNKKWDWYKIGGRWTGYFPVKPPVTPRLGEPELMTDPAKPGRADIVMVRDVDMVAVMEETKIETEKFWVRWQCWTQREPILDENGEVDGWGSHSVRRMALNLGLLRVVNPSKDTAPAGWLTSCQEWERCTDSRASWLDTFEDIDRESFMRRFTDQFNPIVPYACLDGDGWHAPGEMGWFGCSSETAVELADFRRNFLGRFIRDADPDAVLVAVDCHI